MRSKAVGVVGLLAIGGATLATTGTTGGGVVDLSDGFGTLLETLQQTLSANSGAIFQIAALFLGISFVIWLFKRFTGGGS